MCLFIDPDEIVVYSQEEWDEYLKGIKEENNPKIENNKFVPVKMPQIDENNPEIPYAIFC